jgi:multiple sugar transport system substrate-binding protein
MRTSKIRFMTAAVGVGLLMLASACGSSGSGGSGGSGASTASSKTPLTLMFGSSGPAETAAVNAAATAFTRQSGIKVKVIAAANLTQQLAQGFAGGQPPDVFYLDPGSFQNYAKQSALASYPGHLANSGAFYPALKASFSYQGKFECEPKDASTLALYINTADWKQAGLTQADIPTNWSQLKSVAARLTTAGRTGLVLDQTHSGIDEFLYQNGGTVVGAGNQVDLNSPQNVQALSYLKGLMTQGVMKFPSQVSAGWSGEAFGKNKAAMAIVGNWVVGAMKADYPGISYQVAPLPAGPTGTKATLAFTNCWGIPGTAKNMAGAVSFVKFLTAPQQQMAFARAFGVIPSLQSLQGQWQRDFPALAAHTEQLPVAHPDIALPGDTQALAAFDAALAQLKTSSPAAILSAAQRNLQALASQTP